MKNVVFFFMIVFLTGSFLSCNNKSQPSNEPTKNVKEPPNTKTHVLKLLMDENEPADLRVDPASKLARLDEGNFVYLLGNLKAPSSLELKSSSPMMTTISMQEARAPTQVPFDPSKEGMGAVVQSGLFQGDIYEASIVCICDRSIDDATRKALNEGKIYLDDICK